MGLAMGTRLGPAEEQLGELALASGLLLQDDDDEDDLDEGGKNEDEEEDDDYQRWDDNLYPGTAGRPRAGRRMSKSQLASLTLPTPLLDDRWMTGRTPTAKGLPITSVRSPRPSGVGGLRRATRSATRTPLPRGLPRGK